MEPEHRASTIATLRVPPVAGVNRRLVWLASYPKSGNTWIRFILSELLLGGVHCSEDIFTGTPLEQGLRLEQLSTERTNVVKIHALHNPAHTLEPCATAAILLVRNPIKVMISNLRYFLLTHGGLPTDPEERYSTLNAYIGDFIRNGGDGRWQWAGWGNWNQHAESWLSDKPYPVLMVHYEHILAEPVKWIQKICEFAELPFAEEEIAKATARWSFTNMRQLEEHEIRSKVHGMFYKPENETAYQQGLRFVGAQGSPLAHVELEDDLLEEAKRSFQPYYTQCGYT